MPRFDRTGPRGMGPRTGRGMGPCAMGYGGGYGMGCGFGQGFGFDRFGGYPYQPRITKEEEIEMLSEELETLEEEMKDIKEYIAELKSKK